MASPVYGLEARYMWPLPYSHCTGTLVAACPVLVIWLQNSPNSGCN